MCFSRGAKKGGGSLILEQQFVAQDEKSIETKAADGNTGLFFLKSESSGILLRQRKLSIASSDLTDDTFPENLSSSSCCSDPTDIAEIENEFSTSDSHLESDSTDSSNQSLPHDIKADHLSASTGKLLDKRKELKSLRTRLQKRLASFSSSLEADIDKEQDEDLSLHSSTSFEESQAVESSTTEQASFEPPPSFVSKFDPHEMRCLVLMAQGSKMQAALKDFVRSHREILPCFRLMGPSSTIAILESVYGRNNPKVVYGPKCGSSGLGEGAHIASLIGLEQVGGVINFVDPTKTTMSPDDQAILTLCNLHNVLLVTNPMTAIGVSVLLRQAMEQGNRDLIPSFFATQRSPAIQTTGNPQKNKQLAALLDVSVMVRIYGGNQS